MAISSKGKRRIRVRDRDYYWSVRVVKSTPGIRSSMALNIISDDRQFMVRMHLCQSYDDPYLVILAPEFGGTRLSPLPQRVVCSPEAVEVNQTRPRHVRALIEWCHDPARIEEVGVLTVV